LTSVLIHLTGREVTLATILRECRLRANRQYGAAYNVDELADSQSVVCFSEMAALNSIQDLASRHGTYGLGFTTQWMQMKGAAPVWYLARGSQMQREIFELVRAMAFTSDPDPAHPLWLFTPFVDYPKDEHGSDPAGRYDWRWEREWRVRADLRFQAHDVALLFAPEAHHASIAGWWESNMLKGAAGLVPALVDVLWTGDHQSQVLRKGPTRAGPDDIDSAPALPGASPPAHSSVEGGGAGSERLQLRREQHTRTNELREWLEHMSNAIRDHGR
jgi:hypothetical protein